MRAATIASLGGRPTTIAAAVSARRIPRRSPAASPRAARRSGVIVRADITQQAALAVSQQSVAYAVAILGENLYQRALLSEGAGGRPALPLTIAGAASAAASAVLVGGSGGAGPGASLGLVVGAVGALATLFVSVDRVKNVKSDPFAWPGPRSWPVFTSIASFAMAAAFVQAFLYGGQQ